MSPAGTSVRSWRTSSALLSLGFALTRCATAVLSLDFIRRGPLGVYSFKGEDQTKIGVYHLTLQILTNVIVCLKLSVLWALHSIDENSPERVSHLSLSGGCAGICCLLSTGGHAAGPAEASAAGEAMPGTAQIRTGAWAEGSLHGCL